MIKAVIFDLWNTLAKKKISVSKTLCDYFDLEFNGGFLSRYERLVQLYEWTSLEELAECFMQNFDVKINSKNKEFIVNTFNEATRTSMLFEGTKRVLSYLKDRYQLVLLSNTTPFETMKSEWLIDEYFKEVFYSYKTGHLKPKYNSFRQVMSVLGLQPEECLFVDDRLENVLAAESTGMKTILFKNTSQLEREMVNIVF